ncbi:hypothetical protein [Neptunomonas japonica]|uniref:hypothetical protein n=1 Tax=Neptunomonas japonica TaxID=417574 RepID=UPI00048B9DCD|nr:hypothetical protein [Neptunomonas japonica]
MESLSTFKQIIDILSALLSPVIAISVAYIAYQQWKLNTNKEKRESNSQKLHIYMVLKRFLRAVDTSRSVDLILYEELQESLALADFYFNYAVTDWLFDVDCEASVWLDLSEISLILENESPEYTKNRREMEEVMNKLQNYHCQLFDVFKSSML